MLRATIWVGVTLAGVVCGLTLVFLSMRSVMDVGGFCAEGGAYRIRQHCPQGVPGVMVGSIWGGLILVGAYVWALARYHVPGLAALLWPALFLSLGWNFFEYAFDPPGSGGGIVWGWFLCGVVFALMGGLPLFVMLPSAFREFTEGRQERPGWPVGMPFGHAQRLAERIQPSGSDSRIVNELERLSRLHDRGGLSDEEFDRAKRQLLKDDW